VKFPTSRPRSGERLDRPVEPLALGSRVARLERPEVGLPIAAAAYFLKIDGIVGESADAKHKGEIELESFGWGESNAGSISGGGAGGGGAGKVQIEELHVVMRTSKASPLLLLACATGQHFKQAVVTVRRAGKAPLDFLVFTCADVLVSAYHVGGSTDVAPTDQVSLRFARIEIEYRSQKADGTADTPVKAGWDVKANKQV
jgi:type VI secretion system secreted protein Hcp